MLESLLSNYVAHFPEEREIHVHILQLLSDCPPLESMSRSSYPAHVTASAVVVDEESIWVIRHPILDAWFQPGGHIERGETPFQAARREALEELGVHCVMHPWQESNRETPFDIDVHAIPANTRKKEPEHWHIDLRFLFHIDFSRPRNQAELETKLLPIGDLASHCPTLWRLAGKLQALLPQPSA